MVSVDLHVVAVVVCGLWRASFMKTKREMIIDLMGGQLVVGGQKRDKVEQGVAPHVHLHSLEVNLCRYLLTSALAPMAPDRSHHRV